MVTSFFFACKRNSKIPKDANVLYFEVSHKILFCMNFNIKFRSVNNFQSFYCMSKKHLNLLDAKIYFNTSLKLNGEARVIKLFCGPQNLLS